MITKLVQLGVVALWLSMTFWLVRTTWFPDESRFEDVELREVLNAMFENWNDRAELVLLENGSEVGRMGISATNASSEDDDVAIEDRRHRLSSEGSLSEFGVLEFTERGGGGKETQSELNARRDKIIWNTVVGVDESYGFTSFDLRLRFPEQGARLELNYVKASEQVAVRVFLNGLPVFQTETTLSELQSSISGGGLEMGMGLGIPMPFSIPFAAGMSSAAAGGTNDDEMLGSVGGWLQEMSSGNLSPEAKGKLAAMRPRLRAKFGRTKIADESMAVYLLLVTAGAESDEDDRTAASEKAIRLYIGEDGRPVLIDTPFGFEAIAEVMIPDPGTGKKSGAKPEVIGRLP